jgi:hypothetical protein
MANLFVVEALIVAIIRGQMPGDDDEDGSTVDDWLAMAAKEGAANLFGGIFRALPSGGGLSQTAVNDNAGASSRMAGAVTGVVSLLTMLFLTDLFADLPQATLGALVLVSALGLFSWGR